MTTAPASLWTARQAAAADRHTMDVLGMASPVLMERAALCVSAEVERLAAQRGMTKVLVLVGPGNNGGDGLAVARQLHGRGRLRVSAVLVTDKRNAASQQQLDWARSHGVELSEALPEPVPADTLVVDALLGTGSRGAPRASIEQALRALASSKVPVVAIDVPSGIDVDSGSVPSVAARADITVTFARSKIGLHLTPGRDFAGQVVVADIGLIAPPDADAEPVELIGPRWVAQRLLSLPAPAHKGQRGHVGVVGGTGGTPGAAILTGTAALRGGAGLVTLAMTDEQLRRALIEARPELMLADPTDRFVAAADTLVVGPGLTGAREGPTARGAIRHAASLGLSAQGGVAESSQYLANLDRSDARPMVWDASALADFPAEPSAGARVLTPHPGEAAGMLARLEGDASWTNARVQANRREAARRLAEATTPAVVVLKGEGTVIAQHQQDRTHLAIATLGGPALATAGTGDVLAGLIAALLGRGVDPWAAACVGVHVHALAGDSAPRNGALAMDIADRLPDALATARNSPECAAWPRLIYG